MKNIFDNAQVRDNAKVYDNIIICGKARLKNFFM